MAEIIKSCNGGLTTLECKGDAVTGRKILFNVCKDGFRRFLLHDAEGTDFTKVGNVCVKAVFAPQITQARRRLDHDGKLFHGSNLSFFVLLLSR